MVYWRRNKVPTIGRSQKKREVVQVKRYTLEIGTFVTGSRGILPDMRERLSFLGQELAHVHLEDAGGGQPAEQTLYATECHGLIAYQDMAIGTCGARLRSVHQTAPEDLEARGCLAELGAAAGITSQRRGRAMVQHWLFETPTGDWLLRAIESAIDCTLIPLASIEHARCATTPAGRAAAMAEAPAVVS